MKFSSQDNDYPAHPETFNTRQRSAKSTDWRRRRSPLRYRISPIRGDPTKDPKFQRQQKRWSKNPPIFFNPPRQQSVTEPTHRSPNPNPIPQPSKTMEKELKRKEAEEVMAPTREPAYIVQQFLNAQSHYSDADRAKKRQAKREEKKSKKGKKTAARHRRRSTK